MVFEPLPVPGEPEPPLLELLLELPPQPAANPKAVNNTGK
jgi:hypothetical protein